MTENTEVQAIWRSSKCKKLLCLSVFVFGLICLLTSAALVLLVFAFMFRSCSEQNECHRSWGKICGGIAALLFVVGASTLLFCHKRRKHSPAFQVVISEIPSRDLVKSPAPILPYNHIPHRQPFVEASSKDLPDYFTAVLNIDEVGLSVHEGFWTKDKENESPPPSYEQALKMLELTDTASDVETFSSPEPETAEIFPCGKSN